MFSFERYKFMIYTAWIWIIVFVHLTATKSINPGASTSLPNPVLISECNNDNQSQSCVCIEKVGTMCHLPGVNELSILQVAVIEASSDDSSDHIFTSSCSCNSASPKNCKGFSVNLVLVSKLSWNETEILFNWDAIKLSLISAKTSLAEQAPSSNYTLVFILIDEQRVYISTKPRICSSLEDDHLINIYSKNRTDFKPAEQYPGLENLIQTVNETLTENDIEVVADFMYWVITALVLIFVLCWVTYAQMAFWCIYHRYSSKGIEVPSNQCWTATYACVSTVIGCMVFFTVAYLLLISPLTESESCPRKGIVTHSEFA
ncbi:uncharacterized protein LOC144435751 [Glandiceps talaboti]